MKITFKNENDKLRNDFFKALFAQIYEIDPKANVDNFYTLFKKRLQKFKEMYNYDLSKMDSCEFNRFAYNNYDIEVDLKDYLEIYSKTNNKNYCYVPELKTSTIGEVPIFNDKNEGIRSPWVLTPVKISYEVLVDTNFPFDTNKEYSLEELKELTESKDVVILEIIFHELEKGYDTKDIPFVDIALFKAYPFKECKNAYNDYYKEFGRKLRDILTNKRKLEDLKVYISSYKEELDKFLNEMPYYALQDQIAKDALERVDSSLEYDELEKLIDFVK